VGSGVIAAPRVIPRNENRPPPALAILLQARHRSGLAARAAGSFARLENLEQLTPGRCSFLGVLLLKILPYEAPDNSGRGNMDSCGLGLPLSDLRDFRQDLEVLRIQRQRVPLNRHGVHVPCRVALALLESSRRVRYVVSGDKDLLLVRGCRGMSRCVSRDPPKR